MKSKLKLGLIVLSALIFSASFGYIVRQIIKGHEAESAFQSLSEQFSETEAVTSMEKTDPDETLTTETEFSVPQTDSKDFRFLPVIRKHGLVRKETTEESPVGLPSEEETDSPSAVATEPEPETPASAPIETKRTEEAVVPVTAASVSSWYHGIPNCVGWLRIDGTAINYPVMQSKDDPEFYLHHAVSGEYSYPGVPFLDARCELGVSNNLIIYGHNMKNGTMFHDLRYYASRDYWQSHKRIRLETVSGMTEYEVMSVIRYNTNQDPFRIYAYTAMDAETFAWFLQHVRARQIYETGIQASAGDELLTLSTCDWTYENGRLLVIARRVR